MWTRRVSSSIVNMGINQDEFVDVLVRALSNETVIKKLQDAVCGQLQQEVTKLKDIIKSKDAVIDKLEQRVNELESGQDDLEQYSRRNSLRISGVDESDSEDVVEKTMNLINNTLGVTMCTDQIDRMHRVGKKIADRPRPILVKFATYRARDKVMRSRRALKDISQSRTEDGGTQGQVQSRIFINEDLTKLRSNLLYHARQLKKQKKLQDCWTWDGVVLIKNNVAKIIPVRCLADLQRIAN